MWVLGLVDVLNSEQCLAHNIIFNNLKACLDGKNLKQLLMLIMGQGGTGKSKLLNALTTTFRKHDASHLLGKTAMSGIAASLIGGITLH
jgi:predicted GTPase